MAVPESADPKDFPVFGGMDKKTFIRRKTNLLAPICHFAEELSYVWSDIRWNEDAITEIVEMVQRREVYFHIYHKMEMGELNEACLNCFWITKFKPFHYISDPDRNVNIIFALALFVRALTFTAKKNGRCLNLTPETIDHLEHALVYRDISKEALMAIAQGLVGIAHPPK